MIIIKIFRAYIVTVIFCISATLAAAGIIVADENAKKISLGSELSVAAVSVGKTFDNESTTDILPIIAAVGNKIAEIMEFIAG